MQQVYRDGNRYAGPSDFVHLQPIGRAVRKRISLDPSEAPVHRGPVAEEEGSEEIHDAQNVVIPDIQARVERADQVDDHHRADPEQARDQPRIIELLV